MVTIMCKIFPNRECKNCDEYQFITEDPFECEGEKECKLYSRISTIEWVRTTPKAQVEFLVQNGVEKVKMFRIPKEEGE